MAFQFQFQLHLTIHGGLHAAARINRADNLHLKSGSTYATSRDDCRGGTQVTRDAGGDL